MPKIKKLKFRRKIFNLKAYTFIEVLVVVTIICVVTAIGVVIYTSSIKRANDAKRKADFDKLREAFVQYNLQNNTYPKDVVFGSPLTDPNGNIYASLLPQDPKYPKYTYSYASLPTDCQGTTQNPCTSYLLGTNYESTNNFYQCSAESCQFVLPTPTPTPLPTLVPTSTPVPTQGPTPFPSPFACDLALNSCSSPAWCYCNFGGGGDSYVGLCGLTCNINNCGRACTCWWQSQGGSPLGLMYVSCGGISGSCSAWPGYSCYGVTPTP